MSPVLVICAFAVFLLAWFLRKKPQVNEDLVPLPVVCAIVILLGAVVVGALASSGTKPNSTPVVVASPSEPAPATHHALPPGAKAPSLTAAGWVNGRPASKPALRVIDVWAPWCLECREVAPGLVRLHKQYSVRGVEFVSLTDMSRTAVDAFVSSFDFPWASGYGASKETVEAFRALRAGVDQPDRQTAPTLYLVDGKGKVLWTDDAGRYRHEAGKQILSDLQAQLKSALEGPAALERGHTITRSSS